VEVILTAVAAEPDEPRLQLLAAVLQLYALDPAGQRQAAVHLAAARAASGGLDRFGGELLEALSLWQAGEYGLALLRLEVLSANHREALLPLKLIEWLCFCRGQELHGPRLLDRALQLAEVFPDHPDRLAIGSFALELCGRLDEARAMAEAAIAERDDNAWADHTLTHCALRSGRLEPGLRQQQARCHTWAHTSDGLRVHNLWHLALLHLALGDGLAAEGVLTELLAELLPAEGVMPVGELIDLIALGWRLELAGHPQGGLWQRLQPSLAGRLDEPLLPFLAVHYAWVLGRSGDQAALAELFSGGQLAAASPLLEARWSWASGGLELVRGVAAAAAGQPGEARALLLPRRDRLRFGGGSDAQVQVLSETLNWLERQGCV
jgi:tetratricopeptide (TPR) repeat protein